MGMDVYGRQASSDTGRYFRAGMASWADLWRYCMLVAPSVTDKVAQPYMNDGDGLGGSDSLLLANVLTVSLESGHAERYIAEQKAKRDAMPDVKCHCCHGHGRRQIPPNVGPGDYPCNGCGGDLHLDRAGSGYVRPWESHLYITRDMVAEFADFLRDCGGFNIR